MKRYAALLALPLASLVLFAGCGGGDDDSGDTTDTTTQTEKPADTGATASADGNSANNGSAQTLALAADPSGALAYDTDSLEAKPGAVNVEFTNDAPIAHDVVFEKDGSEVARSEIITGGNETVSFDAEPGEYTFYCSLPGHEAAGMKGTLTVK